LLNRAPTQRKAICLYSGLSGASAGGVQESGRIAWQGIAQHVQRTGGSVKLIVYGEADAADLQLPEPSSVGSEGRWTRKRQIAFGRWKTPLICVWHIDLLQFLPLLRWGAAERVVFLHGIEAWRPLGRLKQQMLTRTHRFLVNSQHTWERFLKFQPQLANKP